MSKEYTHCLDVMLEQQTIVGGKFQLESSGKHYCSRKDLNCPCQRQNGKYLPECGVLGRIQDSTKKVIYE